MSLNYYITVALIYISVMINDVRERLKVFTIYILQNIKNIQKQKS